MLYGHKGCEMVAAAIGMISDAVSIAKRLREISKTIENAEFSLLLADLQLELANIKATMADMVIENTSLRNRVAELEEASNAKGVMAYDGMAYRKPDDPSAYCPNCWDGDGKQIRLNETGTSLAKYLCPNCKSPFGIHIG